MYKTTAAPQSSPEKRRFRVEIFAFPALNLLPSIKNPDSHFTPFHSLKSV